ncbi:Heme-binding-like protein [Picochlorum sp. SENEW3]|nr:Heme-binding-like protein [Picochlorum sp. SENEW3]|mmetsp:Transcript_11024/g.22015  ORF Transcript_11024/g.22015 Transcript_11024/m.22015 type:complete len:243 (+) Transcript_11024:214-942(+)
MVNSVAIAVPVGIAAGVFALWHGLTYYEVDMKCEKPKYSVLKKLGTTKTWYGKTVPKAELRRYAPYLVAYITSSGDSTMREALGSGFRQIAGFIFGKNTSPTDGSSSKVAMTSPVTLEYAQQSEKIAMTSPVAAESLGDNTYKVAFIMPSKYTKETLPKPVNDNVKIEEVGSHTMAAMTWRGSSPSEQTMMSKASELKLLCEQEGLKTKGNIHLYQYHPPFAPAWMRINEVLYEIDDIPAST